MEGGPSCCVKGYRIDVILMTATFPPGMYVGACSSQAAYRSLVSVAVYTSTRDVAGRSQT